MCGIVGVLGPQPIDPDIVKTMREELIHRGPDHAGLWSSDDGEIVLGHRRLAIVDLKPEANQPFISEDRRFVTVYNGEIYNFRGIRRELEELGVRFRTESDTEVLVEAFRQWGEDCLGRLSGMFAFGIWDAEECTLFCARDRVGEKPFYYGTMDGVFLFASEMKALVAWPGFRREIHYPALIDFLTFGFIVDPKTIWEGVHKLPPGHCVTIRKAPGAPPAIATPRRYWDLEFRPDEAEKNWSPRILETLQTAAHEMSYADVPVGSFLSGGVDSASVTAALSRAGCNVTAFTVGFDEPDHDERGWARQVTAAYGTPHVEQVVRADDVLSVFRRMTWHYDEPFNDYSYLPTFYLCREARRSITVALSGDGGDEAFAGYGKYRRLAARESLDAFVPEFGRRIVRGAAGAFPPRSSWRRALAQHGANAVTMLSDMLFTGFQPGELPAICRGPLADAVRSYRPGDTVEAELQRAPPAEVGLINAMRYLDFKITLASGILVKVDRASMAVSLEVRPVHLHRDIVALAQLIPSSRLATRTESKAALKDALRPWLPEPLLYRKKQGFAMPLHRWFREHPELSASLWDDRDGGALDDLFDWNELQKRVRVAQADRGNTTALLHSLLFLREWFARWT